VQDVVANLVGLVKPGGWIELVEPDVGGPKDSGPALREIFTLGGMGGNFALKMRGWLEAAGLEAVEQRFVDCPAGARNARALWRRALMGYGVRLIR